MGAVDFRVICYLPYNIAVALSPQREMWFSTYHLAVIFTCTTVHSSLNPLLYCWKIREVRQAVKETLRQVFCRSIELVFWAFQLSLAYFMKACHLLLRGEYIINIPVLEIQRSCYLYYLVT